MHTNKQIYECRFLQKTWSCVDLIISKYFVNMYIYVYLHIYVRTCMYTCVTKYFDTIIVQFWLRREN